MDPLTQLFYQLGGWIMFMFSAVGFTLGSLANKAFLIASLLFLAACFVFIIPLSANIRHMMHERSLESLRYRPHIGGLQQVMVGQ